jgi:hypothetical protein
MSSLPTLQVLNFWRENRVYFLCGRAKANTLYLSYSAMFFSHMKDRRRLIQGDPECLENAHRAGGHPVSRDGHSIPSDKITLSKNAFLSNALL